MPPREASEDTQTWARRVSARLWSVQRAALILYHDHTQHERKTRKWFDIAERVTVLYSTAACRLGRGIIACTYGTNTCLARTRLSLKGKGMY